MIFCTLTFPLCRRPLCVSRHEPNWRADWLIRRLNFSLSGRNWRRCGCEGGREVMREGGCEGGREGGGVGVRVGGKEEVWV